MPRSFDFSPDCNTQQAASHTETTRARPRNSDQSARAVWISPHMATLNQSNSQPGWGFKVFLAPSQRQFSNFKIFC